MTTFRNLWHMVWTGLATAGMAGRAHGAAGNDLAALRLYSLPRGIRQRSRYCLLQI
jgi:hypothetical protein